MQGTTSPPGAEYPTQWRNWNLEISLSFVFSVFCSFYYTMSAQQLVLDPRIGKIGESYTSVPAASRCITSVDKFFFFRCSCSGCAHQALADACGTGCFTQVPTNASDPAGGTSLNINNIMESLHRIFTQAGVDDAGINQTSSNIAFTIPWLHAVLSSELRMGCPYGERLFPEPVGCAMVRPWPSALNLDAQIPTSIAVASVSQQACGRWIAAKMLEGSFLYDRLMSFYDSADQAATMLAVASLRSSAPSYVLSAGSMSKYRSVCERTHRSGPTAVFTSIAIAYSRMAILLTNVQIQADGQEAFVQLQGVLAGAACPSVLQLDLALDMSGFISIVVAGENIDSSTMRAAMRIVGLPERMVGIATALLDRIKDKQRSIIASDANYYAEHVTFDTLRTFIGGASRWFHELGGANSGLPAWGASERIASYDAFSDASLDALILTMRSYATWSDASTRREAELALALGQAAMCATVLSGGMHAGGALSLTPGFSTQVVNAGDEGAIFRSPDSLSNDAAGTHDDAGALHANDRRMGPGVWIADAAHRAPNGGSNNLGRNGVWRAAGRAQNVVAPVSRATRAANRETSRASLSEQTPFDAQRQVIASGCLVLAQSMFVELMDRRVFDSVVTPMLYGRLRTLVGEMQLAVARVVGANPGGIFVNPQAAARAVQRARVRIVGAPPGTWGGTARSPPLAFTQVRSGMVAMGLRQAAAAMYLRLSHATNADDPCEHPPLWEATSTNAYYLHPFGCVLLFPGMLRRPFADEMYDEESLRFRIGTIVAHELAHATDYQPLRPEAEAQLMRHHPHASTHIEARADLIAALATVHAPGWNESARVRRFALHWAQLWCGVAGVVQSAPSSHPPVNVRADALCSTLADLGVACV